MRVEAGSLKVRDQAASTLALVTGELIANALTHGLRDDPPPVLRISLDRDGETDIVLAVSDNGPGLPGAALREGFGLWLARSLAAQVRGKLTMAAAPGGGVRAELRFPL